MKWETVPSRHAARGIPAQAGLRHHQRARRRAGWTAGHASFAAFVVQRHRASRLHYDFRLEIGGVLASWALPRGPSMRPLSKRRAARTEDHPIEYLDFEGIIPVGEYGGGDVIVWDQGTWEPEGLDEPAAAVEDGELKFALHGQRLRGRFVLVRTHKENQFKEDWLLIHKAGEESDPFWDIRDYPTSVRSGLTNEQVASARPPPRETAAARSMEDIDLSAARQVALPAFIPPMLATPVDRAFSDPDWLFELKLDGYRVQAIVHGKAVQAAHAERQGRGHLLPRLRRRAGDLDRRLPRHRRRRDGGARRDGRPDFGLLQDLAGMRGLGVHRGERKPRAARMSRGARGRSSTTPSTCSISTAGTSSPSRSRSASACCSWSLREHPSVRYVSHILEHGEDFQKAVIEQGLEGSVAKLRRSRYEPGRAHASLAQGQGPPGAGAGPRRLRAGQGQSPRPRRAARGHPRGRRAGASPGRSAAAWTRHAQAAAPPPRRAPLPTRPRRA